MEIRSKLFYVLLGIGIGDLLIYLRLRNDYLRSETILYLQQGDLSIFSGLALITFFLCGIYIIAFKIIDIRNSKREGTK